MPNENWKKGHTALAKAVDLTGGLGAAPSPASVPDNTKFTNTTQYAEEAMRLCAMISPHLMSVHPDAETGNQPLLSIKDRMFFADMKRKSDQWKGNLIITLRQIGWLRDIKDNLVDAGIQV